MTGSLPEQAPDSERRVSAVNEGLLESGDPQAGAPADFGPGLSRVRRRRWLLWFVLVAYLPTMWTTQRITHSFQKSLPVFFGWILLLILATMISALAKCPRCGNYFHVNGMALFYLRKCLHCQLHLCEDKKKSGGRAV